MSTTLSAAFSWVQDAMQIEVRFYLLSVVKAGYRFSGAAAPCSGVQGMYKLPAAAFAQCILLPTLQNVGVKLLATF